MPVQMLPREHQASVQYDKSVSMCDWAQGMQGSLLQAMLPGEHQASVQCDKSVSVCDWAQGMQGSLLQASPGGFTA